MTLPELRLPKLDTDSTISRSSEVDSAVAAQLGRREYVMRGVASGVMLLSGEEHVGNVPIAVLEDVARRVNDWHPDDHPIGPSDIKRALL